jgi:5-(carboxyamino)imidazole ribonucleotide synthase
VRSGYDDAAGLARLAQISAAITTEFENVPAPSLALLAKERPVAPAAEAVAVCQDRAAEKASFERSGVPCAPHALMTTEAELAAVDAALLPGILKTNRLGYDGKGQVRVADRAALAQAWESLKRVPCLLEKMLPLQREYSVIVARDALGRVVHFPAQQNLHRDGILAVTRVPAPDLDAATAQRAIDCARAIAAGLGWDLFLFGVREGVRGCWSAAEELPLGVVVSTTPGVGECVVGVIDELKLSRPLGTTPAER